jgi:hypothetical protein
LSKRLEKHSRLFLAEPEPQAFFIPQLTALKIVATIKASCRRARALRQAKIKHGAGARILAQFCAGGGTILDRVV